MSSKKKHRHIWFHESELRKKTNPPFSVACCCWYWFCQRWSWRRVKSRADLTCEAGGTGCADRRPPGLSWTAGNFCLVFTCIPGLWFLLPSQGRPCISYPHGNGFGVQALCSDHRLGKPGAAVLLAAEKTIINRKRPKISQGACCPRCISASAELSMEGATLLAVIAYFQLD